MQFSHASEIEKIDKESQEDFKKQFDLVKSLQSENKQLKQRFDNVKVLTLTFYRFKSIFS